MADTRLNPLDEWKQTHQLELTAGESPLAFYPAPTEKSVYLFIERKKPDNKSDFVLARFEFANGNYTRTEKVLFEGTTGQVVKARVDFERVFIILTQQPEPGEQGRYRGTKPSP